MGWGGERETQEVGDTCILMADLQVMTRRDTMGGGAGGHVCKITADLRCMAETKQHCKN